MAHLVTGEAVAVDIRVARIPSRALAIFLDLLIQYFVLNSLSILITPVAEVADPAFTAGLTLLITVLVIVGYPVTIETLTRGRSLGKMALGLRVVGDDGSPVRFRQALVRALAGFIELFLLFGSPALITALFNHRGKRLGDIFAGTIVIQERVAPMTTGYRAAPIMPPQLAGWAGTLELSRIPDDLALAARQYTVRFWDLAPAVRDELGQRILQQVLSYVSPPPPPGLRPEIYLSAVLAERRRREEWRLAERAARRAAVLHRTSPVYPGSAGIPRR